MCHVCCKKFEGWCKSFTRIEVFLLALLALLLLVLIGLLTFLVLHLLVCSDELDKPDITTTTYPTSKASKTTHPFAIPYNSTALTGNPTKDVSVHTTLPSNIKCTWTPSKKTKARTRYYLTKENNDVTDQTLIFTQPTSTNFFNKDDFSKDVKHSDGSDAFQTYKNYVAALIKLKPPEDVTFGCILTKVTRHWALTAASCIESIEEVESLDMFFITDSFGTVQEGRNHAVMDVQIHPLYQGANRSYDLAALRSDNALIPSTQLLVQLPSILDFFLVAVGERFTILGYGGYRTIDKSPTGRRLREVSTYTVSLAQCGSPEDIDVWAPRHLMRGGAVTAGSCGTTGSSCGAHALCAGSLHSRTAPCSYCSGTPLLRDGKLFGIMAENRHCGVACEPTLYVNIAALKDWVESIIIT